MERREVDLRRWEERDGLVGLGELLCHGMRVRHLRRTIGSVQSHSERPRVQMFSNVSWCPAVLLEETMLIGKEGKVVLRRCKSRNQ